MRAADGACMPPRARRGRCRMLGQRAGNARRMSRLWALASSRFRVSAFPRFRVRVVERSSRRAAA
ncbi:hypothetical protein GBP346_B1124 [Burkholderia pseudomallei MSHR346]|nr:hypothetical protein GBP346_B1124 [Burkholderia pseudomallei MSHR346]